MMYSEFVQETGCKKNDFNYEVFTHLEAIYMMGNATKQEIYEVGKKLVDNSPSEAEIKLEREIKAEIENVEEQIEFYKMELNHRAELAKYCASISDKVGAAAYKRQAKYSEGEIKAAKARIAALKWVLNS